MRRFTCILGNAILAAALSSHTTLAENQDRGQETYQIVGEGYGRADQEIYGRGGCMTGVDMPAGEHAVFTEDASENHTFSSCIFTLYRNDRDEKKIDTPRSQHHGLITLYSGQHLILSRGYAIPADQADISTGTAGTYKVGRGMEPGTRRLTPLTPGDAHYALYSDVRYYYDYMDGYQTFFEPVTMTLEERQCIELMDVSSVEKIDWKIFKTVEISVDVGKWKCYYS